MESNGTWLVKAGKFWKVRWVDPSTGRVRQRTTGCTRQREAYRVAEQVATEVFAGLGASDAEWVAFCRRYERERVNARSPNTAKKWRTARRWVESGLGPQRVGDVSASRLSRLVGDSLAGGANPRTVQSKLNHVTAALSWAQSIGLIPAVPRVTVPQPTRRKQPKGRAITAEEFERMLDACPKVVGEPLAPSWQWLLRGLWCSGLRLSEALACSWDDPDGILPVGVDGRRPMLQIPAELEKGGSDRLLPITPEFAELLRAVPERNRVGLVFVPEGQRGPIQRMETVSATVCEIGKRSKVVVSQGRKRKCASAHDLRRSFGFRWALRVMPSVLQQLMRHEQIETTMRYYVGQEAGQFADAVWATVTGQRDDLRDTTPGKPTRQRGKNPSYQRAKRELGN